MATTSEHNAARSDIDLLQRLIATAEQQGIPNAQMWAEENLGRLIAVDVADGQCVADVHACASVIRANAVASLPMAPGLDPAAVTDTHLIAAVEAVRQETE